MKSTLFLILISFASIVLAQEPGRLLGIVTNAKSGDSLANVNISIVGSTLGASSNAKGAYLIRNIPAGTHAVIFSCMGFQADTVYDVIILPGQAKRLDAALTTTVLQMQPIKVEANRLLTLETGATRPGVQRINPEAVEHVAG